MLYLPNYKKPFAAFVKKQHPPPDFLFTDFYALGVHENFYDDLKIYLRANGWYK